MALNSDLNPQKGVQGTSYLYDFGTSPNTRTALSQKIRVLTPAYGNNKAMFQMGVLNTFTPGGGSRNVEPVKGIGFGDQIAEIVPATSEPVTLSFNRALLYLANLFQSTGYAAGVDGPVRAIKHQVVPMVA